MPATLWNSSQVFFELIYRVKFNVLIPPSTPLLSLSENLYGEDLSCSNPSKKEKLGHSGTTRNDDLDLDVVLGNVSAI